MNNQKIVKCKTRKLSIFSQSGFGTILEPKLYPRSRIFLDPKGTRLADFRDFKGVAFEDEMDAQEIFQNYKLRERAYTQDTDMSSRMLEYDDRGMFRGVSEFNRFGRMRREETTLERPNLKSANSKTFRKV